MSAAVARPASAVQCRGVWVDPQTRDMVEELAWLARPLVVRAIQGCWSTGVAASAGTHSRACVIDIDAEPWTDAQALHVSALWRSLGGFGWFRKAIPGVWQRHCHLAHPDGDMAPALADQWTDYKAGRNGLANKGPDPETRAYVGMTWAKYMEANVTNEQLQQILAAIKAVPAATWNVSLTLDSDGSGPIKPTVAPAQTWLKMGDYFANKAFYNTDTLEPSLAKLATAVDGVATTAEVAELKAALDALTAKVDALPKAPAA